MARFRYGRAIPCGGLAAIGSHTVPANCHHTPIHPRNQPSIDSMSRDFSRQNLRGRSFKGQDLSGANFQGAQIQGTNFTRANLTGADFSHTKAGLKPLWAIALVVLCALVSLTSGFISAFAGDYIQSLLTSQQVFSVGVGLVIIILLGVLARFIVKHGLEVEVKRVAAVAILIALVGGAIAVTMDAGDVSGAIAVLCAVISTAAVAVAGICACSALGIAGILTFAIVPVVGGFFIQSAGSWIGSLLLAAAAAFITQKAARGYQRYTIIRELGVAIAAWGGTRFHKANLTQANFTGATIQNADFNKAILADTCWNEAEKLMFARFDETHLTESDEEE